jgi:hypothetical protein
VRRDPPKGFASTDELTRLELLGHEVGHVLQDQRGIDFDSGGDFDNQIAHAAVIEGDATLTAVLLIAARERLRPERAVERRRLQLRSATFQEELTAAGDAPVLLGATSAIRNFFDFRYRRGFRFVSDVYAAGGLPLVDRMLARPPTSTDLVFSPERWLDGGGARLGRTATDQPHVGAWMLHMVAELCRADAADLRWIEDHFIDDLLLGEGALMGWVTRWDSVDPNPMPRTPAELKKGTAAGRISNRVVGCLGSPIQNRRVQMTETEVAIADDSSSKAEALVSWPRTPAGQPFAVGTKIPPARYEVAFRYAGPGQSSQGRWRHDQLGLELPIAADITLAEVEGAALSLEDPAGAGLAIVFFDQALTRDTADGWMNELLEQYAAEEETGDRSLDPNEHHSWKAVSVGWTQGLEVARPMANGATLTVRFLHLCERQAALALVAMARNETGAAAIQGYFRQLSGVAAPMLCTSP